MLYSLGGGLYRGDEVVEWSTIVLLRVRAAVHVREQYNIPLKEDLAGTGEVRRRIPLRRCNWWSAPREII